MTGVLQQKCFLENCILLELVSLFFLMGNLKKRSFKGGFFYHRKEELFKIKLENFPLDKLGDKVCDVDITLIHKR